MHNAIRDVIGVSPPEDPGLAIDSHFDFAIQDDPPLGLMMMGRNFGRTLHGKKDSLHPRALKQFRLDTGKIQVRIRQIFDHLREKGIVCQMVVLPGLNFLLMIKRGLSSRIMKK